MDVVSIVVGLVGGVVIGYGLALVNRAKATSGPAVAETDWWELRKTLTGTQLQILQYMEEKRQSKIAALQEKFSFIPDRELFYRLEQIVLLGFIERERKDGDVLYVLNPAYSGKVEDDKTVMLSSE
ncbi:MAG: hypothetical protein ACFHX7_23950 [Pseudomonadota bacterium]